MPVVKISLCNTDNIPKILKDENIYIGYSKVEPEIFDRYKSRPKFHFKQCKNCYKLNHTAKECPKKVKSCKYCGLTNHSAIQCFHRNNPKRQKCILCNGNHPSDSIICEVIQNTRKKLGIHLTKKEQQFIQRINSNQEQVIQISRTSNINRNSLERSIPYSYARAAKNDREEIERSESPVIFEQTMNDIQPTSKNKKDNLENIKSKQK
jgi:hypothetical protein